MKRSARGSKCALAITVALVATIVAAAEAPSPKATIETVPFTVTP